MGREVASGVTDTAGKVEVTKVATEHLPALAGFYAQVWDPGATAAGVRASRDAAASTNPVTPGEPPPTWIVLRDDRAIGHVTTIPIVLWIGGQERPAYWIKGLWVLPEFQRSAVGFLVLRTAVQQLGAVAALALAHDPAALRLFGALGFRDLGTLPNDLRVLNARRVLSRLDPAVLPLGSLSRSTGFRVALRAGAALGPLADAATGLWGALAGVALGAFETQVDRQLDRAGADGLWQAARTEITAGPRRMGAELAGRYETAGYSFVHVRSGARLAGLGVLRHPSEDGDPRLRGIRVATLADLLYRPSEPRAGLAVLRGAERTARALGADAMLAGASAASCRPLLRRRGFAPVPANLHLLSRIPGDSPATVDQWWFTRGDSGGDGQF
jgi:GNAT superfamily N-acetyltransferase